jgi:hypothetical protein
MVEFLNNFDKNLLEASINKENFLMNNVDCNEHSIMNYSDDFSIVTESTRITPSDSNNDTIQMSSSDERIEQDYILLIMNCNKYREKALVQKAGWLQTLPEYIQYYHVLGDPELESPYLFNDEDRTLWVKTLDDYVSLPKKVISAIHAVRSTFKFKYIFAFEIIYTVKSK